MQYVDIVPFVGLNPERCLHDITTFDLYRSRISASLFRSIVQDMDVLLRQYGPPFEHATEEATSQFLATVRILLLRRNSGRCFQIFEHLIAQIGSAFKKSVRVYPSWPLNYKRKIEYHFEAFGFVGALFREVRLKVGGAKERMDAIAKVIAQCNGQASFQ